ncbi:MAG: amino acid adenylation domain-containing protein, partial [Acidobacteriota bacterium]
RSLGAPRRYLLDIQAWVSQGRLHVEWTYSRNLHRQSSIESLSDSFTATLRTLIEHCMSAEAGGCTPSDFPLARLSQEELDRLAGAGGQIEDLYPLSPVQQGMLFHALYQPGLGQYVVQYAFRLDSRPDESALQKAWPAAVRRHPALRSSFHWRDLEQPLQMVHRDAAPAWQLLDWSGEGDARRQMEDFLEEDRQKGFDLSRPPLMRLTLIRLGGQSCQLVLTCHHLIADGWSLGLVLKEVFSLYEAFVKGTEPQLAASFPFRNYIAYLSEQQLPEAEAFWRKSLAGFEAATPLGVDTPPSGAPSQPAFDWKETRLPVQQTESLQALARRSHLTLNTVVQGAWALLLSRYSGHEDVLFGIAVSGRPTRLIGVESTVGPFINTLPLRLQASPGEKLISWLERIQEHVTEMRQYENSPLTEVRKWSDVPAGNPLFESILAFENYPVDESLGDAAESLRISDVRSRTMTNYPLNLIVGPGNQLLLRIGYDSRRFEAGSILRMLSHLQVVLNGMLRGDQSLGQLPLLTDGERHALLQEWNATQRDCLDQATIPDLLQAQADLRPDAVAAVSGEGQMSYAELQRRSGRLAAWLKGQGVRRESRLGIFVERSLEMVVGLAGTLQAGAAYLPLDPAYPSQRLRYMIDDAQACLALTQQSLLQRLPGGRFKTICLDQGWPRFAEGDPGPQADPDSLAYLMYTSGSTGRPKGVGVVHRGVVRLVKGIEFARLGPDQVFLHMATLSFDASTFQIWGCLLNGGRLVLYPPGRPTLERLERCIDSYGITYLGLPAALFRLMVEQSLPALCRVPQVLSGGDVLSASHARRALQAGLGRLINAYGPTENTTYTCCQVMEKAEEWSSVPIGPAIANTAVYVLDRRMDLVPQGVAGELCTGGLGLARGYMGRPGMTAERFLPSPFAEGQRLYRTGDLVRIRSGGVVEFLGRLDFQCKIRGFRIEPGEVEFALHQHPQVKEAAVLLRGKEAGKERLVAYLVERAEGVGSRGSGLQSVRSSRFAARSDSESDSRNLEPGTRDLSPLRTANRE